MEEIYANYQHKEPDRSAPPTDSKSFERWIILCLGLLSVSLLAGIIALSVQNRRSDEMTANLMAISGNLSEELSIVRVNLSEITKERNILERLSKQKKRCLSGWTMFGCSCFLLSAASDSWDSAREDCRRRGADLVLIETPEEQKFLSEFTKVETWIGLSDRETEGTWKWVDGTELTLRNWLPRQPDNGGGLAKFGEEDCAHLSGNNRNFWNDINCSSRMRWICEMAPN